MAIHAASAVIALLLAVGVSPASAQSADVTRIRVAMKAIWDKPNLPLQVEPVVTVGDHGIAGWVQGERGGRALLRRHGREWKVIVCGGDGLTRSSALQEAGIPVRDAERMVQSLARAESQLPAATVKKFSLFDGVVRVDSSHAAGHK